MTEPFFLNLLLFIYHNRIKLNEPSQQESKDMNLLLRGRSLAVYIYMLRQAKPLGIREIQRDLGFSSPSLVLYYLDKLQRLGIVGKDEMGRFILVQKVDVAVLNAFVNVGRFALPRLGFYAALFTTLAVGLAIIGGAPFAPILVAGIALGAAIAFWYETLRIWRKRPF